MSCDVARRLNRNVFPPRRLQMSALPSQLTLAQIDRVPAALVCTKSAKTRPMEPWMILRSIGEQVHALFLAQRALTGQLGNSAWAAEDDYARFANRPR